MSRLPKSLFRRVYRDQSGAVAILIGVALLVLVGMAGFVIDVGNMVNAHRQLQDSADLAALAGAAVINTGTSPITTATSYSGVAGNRNANPNLTVTMVSGYPVLKCFTTTGIACAGSPSANAIVVKEQATVPMYFISVFGFTSVTVTATATASAKGGGPPPLNVVFVLDTTQSMNSADASCSTTKLACAVSGVQTLLNALWPTQDSAALFVYPGVKNATNAGYDYDCSSSTPPTIVGYNSSPLYQIVGFSADYRASNTANNLNTASNLAKAVGAGGTGCAQGIQAVGGVGTFFADAITAAQNYLVTTGTAKRQNVIILLSDGDANAASSNMPAAEKNNQCHEAITAASTATAAGTWVYAIAYGASTSSASSCSTDMPAISACSTMQQIASDPSRFYSDTIGGASTCTSAANPITALSQIFQNIGNNLTTTRLLPDSTQ